MRRSEWLDTLRQDLGYGLRIMGANPSLTAAVGLTIALGIGATTSIFSVVNAVLLRELPYTDADRLVALRERMGEEHGSVAVGPFLEWSAKSSSFVATALAQGRSYNLTDGEPARYSGARVTPSYFQVLHMAPAVGRYFLPGETDASRVVVLSHGLWQSRFGGDSSIVGRQITANGERHTVVGVTPAAYTLTGRDEQLWTIFTFTPQQRANYGSHTYRAYAKLKPGVSIRTAENELEPIAADIRARYPELMSGRGVAVLSYREWRVGDYATQLWVLLGAVTFVLMIGCVNVASLLLARASTRRKEMAIRGALGGAPGRLARQLLTESLLLAVVGGALGVLVAGAGVRFLVGMGPGEVPRLGEAGLQLDVLTFAALVTLLCGLLFGLAPALRATRVDLQTELQSGGRSSRAAVRDRARAALIVMEIAVTLVLLVSATLFLRSAHRLQQVAIGFEPTDVTMMRVALPADRYDSAAVVHAAFSRLVDEMRAIPGVRTAGAGSRVPMLGTNFEFSLRVESRPEEGESFFGNLRLITPGYTETLGIPLRRGRTFQESDLVAGAPPVVIVNESFAKKAFGGADPIGQRISGWTAGSEPEWREVVGVIGDVRASGPEQDIPFEIYAPHSQARQSWWNAHQRSMAIVVKTRPGAMVAPAMRAALRRIDPQLPHFDLQTMDAVVSQSTATRRFHTTLLALLGATALVLAAIGVYGVVAFVVSQRTHEIGVRVALGATTRDIVGIVMQQALVLAVVGIGVGGVVAMWATRVLSSMLFQVETRDPVSFAVGAVVLLLVALGASLLPARRAARVDPVRVLASG